jgi:hypothetical protein
MENAMSDEKVFLDNKIIAFEVTAVKSKKFKKVAKKGLSE